MAELDLSLSDALTDSVAQPGPESLVERDFVAQLEAEAFDDQVGETVGKTDYVPLLDDDNARPDTGAALENGAQEAHGVQKPGLKPTAGGQTTSSHPEARGEAWPRSADQQQASAADFLSASMAGYSDPLGSQTGPAQMTDADLMGPFSGFSQSAGLGVNMEVGAAPLSAERMPSIAEPQHPTPLVGSEAPKEHVPMRPEPQAPRSPLDLATGASGDCWPDQAGRLPTELPFTPAVSAAISRHAGDLAVSPDDPPDGWPGRESAGCAGGDERDGEGSDRKQKKKKKRRQKEEGSHEQLESKGHLELQEQGDTSPSTEEFYHRIGPRRDRGDGGWEEQLGKSGGRGKRGKSRKKIPDEWGVMAFVPASSQEAKAGLGSSNRAEVDASYSPWRQEVYPEEGLVPVPLSQDLFSITAPSIHPLVLNSELNATAAPFTMPSAADGATLGARPAAALPGDSPPMDAENASSGGEAFSQPFSPGDEAPGGDTIDSGMFDGSGSLQEDRDVPDGDTSAFSPAARSSPGRSPKSEVLASAPPLSPSDASWLLNESQMSGSSEMFDFTDPSGRPLPLGLSFDAPSPAPLRSPKTTAQEFHPSPSAVKTSKAPVIGPSSPPSATPLAVPGSGLNPSAKPFFPSFADSMEEAAAVPPIAEVKSDMMEKAEKKEEKLEGSSAKVDLFDPPDEAEQKSVKVELEKEMEGEKRNETGKGEEKEKKVDKVSEKEAEKVQESKIEKVIEDEETEKVKEDKEKDKVEEKQTVKVEEKKETEKVKEDKVEEKQTVKVEEKKETEKVKEDKVEEKQMVKVEEKKETEKVKEDKEKDKVEEKQTVKVEEKKETEKVKVTEVEKVREDKETEKVQEKEAEKMKEHKETEKVKVTEAEKVKEDKEKDKVQEKQTVKVEEKEKEMEKMEPVQQKAEQEDKMKVEESPDELVKTEKVDKVKVTEESKVDKTENLEKSTVEENTETKNLAKLETAEVKDDKKLLMDDVEMIPEKQPTPSKLDSSCDTLENKAETKTPSEAGETKTATEVAPVEEKKAVEKKAPKGDGGDKAKKAKPVSNGTGAAPSKELGSADRKTKPAAGALKPTAAAKARPSSAAASLAPAKRPTPSNATSVTDKKTAASKAPPTAAAGPKRLSATSAGRPASSSLAGARDLKPKTPAEKRPLVPKAGTAASNQTASSAATKNGTAAASKTAMRAAPSARTSTTTAAKKPLASRTDGKPGDEKRPSALRTSAANATKPKTATAAAARSSAPPAAASRPRTTAAKPATPSSAAAPEKKPSVSRAVRTASSTAATSKTAARPGAAAGPDVRNARSKIGSTDNMKHQPGGGKVSSASQSRALTSKDMSQGKVHIVSKKADFSHVTSRLGSKDNVKHVPGGGNVQILNKKVDLSKVTSKCGSKDNIKHKPGGGDVKIESHKVSFREKAQSKVGSMDNVSHSPGGGNVKAEGAQETTEGNGTPPSGAAAAAPASGPEPGRAGSPSARANGLKEGPPCDSEGLPEPRALDSRIPETSI